MSFYTLADRARIGLLPLRDHRALDSAGTRTTLAVARLEEAVNGRLHLEDEGFLECGHYWSPADTKSAVRPKGMGSFAAPVIQKWGSGERDKKSEGLRPIKTMALDTDPLYASATIAQGPDPFPRTGHIEDITAPNGNRRIDREGVLLRLASGRKHLLEGSPGLVVAGTETTRQESLLFESWNHVLLAQGSSKDDADYGTRVVGHEKGKMRPYRSALLSSLIHAYQTLEGEASAALNLSANPDDSSGYGLCFGRAIVVPSLPEEVPLPYSGNTSVERTSSALGSKERSSASPTVTGVLAYASAERGGILDVGGPGDQHQIGTTAEGLGVYSLHASTRTLFRGDGGDGSLAFEGTYPDKIQEGLFPFKCYLSWNGREQHEWYRGKRTGKWRIWTRLPMEVPDPAPPPPPPPGGKGDGKGGGNPPDPRTPRTPGKDYPPPNDGSSTRPTGGYAFDPTGNAYPRGLVTTPFNWSFGSIHLTPVTLTGRGITINDFSHDFTGESLDVYKDAPLCGALFGWGKEAAGSVFDLTENGTPIYQGRHGVSGGWNFAPSEISCRDFPGGTFSTPTISVSTAYLNAHKEYAYFSCGLPNTTTGGISYGFRWQSDASGNLSFDYVTSDGENVDDVIQFTSAGLTVNGKITCTGAIDPTYLETDDIDTPDAPAASHIRWYSKSGAPYFRPASGSETAIYSAANASRQTLSFGAEASTAGKFLIANGTGTLTESDSAAGITRGEVQFAGTIRGIAWNSAAADATTDLKIQVNSGDASKVDLTGAEGSISGLSIAVAAGDFVEVEFDAGTAPGGMTCSISVQ